MPLVMPEYGVVFGGGKPARDCEFPECPRRKRGYDGHKMKACSKCRYGTDCQRSHWRVHKLTCRVPGLDSPHAWMNKYRGFSRWAATQALYLHSDHSTFRENDATLNVLILHGKQALGEDTPTDFRVLRASMVPRAGQDHVGGRRQCDSGCRGDRGADRHRPVHQQAPGGERFCSFLRSPILGICTRRLMSGRNCTWRRVTGWYRWIISRLWLFGGRRAMRSRSGYIVV
ncbi:hypothetical protein BDZ89DRAFT_360505 [Hymenopellis radicata]|nr:hypothetical protein BDZ89DRAFT_360505 [Hymenopellis radicata]